jgi:putative transposase
LGLTRSEVKDLALATYQVLDPKPPKRLIAVAFNLSRQNLYYERTLEEKDNELRQRIEQLHKTDDTLGCLKLAKLLSTSKNRVFRVMLKYDITPRKDTPAYKYLGKSNDVVSNQLRNLNQGELEQYTVLVSDILQFRLIDRTWVYCCFVIKQVTRQVLSFTYGYSMKAELVGEATKDLNRVDLIEDLNQKPVIFHSDQGSQYGAETSIGELDRLNFQRSMSRAGTPTDNPISERFVRTFKLAVTKRYKYQHLEEFVEFATKWINFYNSQRPHHSLRQKSPNQFAQESGLNKVEFLYLRIV